MAEDSVVNSTGSDQSSKDTNNTNISSLNQELSNATKELRTEEESKKECSQKEAKSPPSQKESLLNGHAKEEELPDCNGHGLDEMNQVAEQNGHLTEDTLTNENLSLTKTDVLPKMVTIITEDKILPFSTDSSALSSPLSSPPAEDSSVPSTPPSTPEEELVTADDAEANNNDSKDEDNSKDAKSEKVEDVIVIQDPTFTIKMMAPGSEPFDLQVSPQEMVQEIHQVLMDREDTCHRTCFSLQVEGNVLDNFAELKSIENLKEGSIIKVVEEPYTVREARIHVRHVRDLLKSLDPADAYNGVECQSLSFLTTILSEDRKRNKPNSNDNVDCTPPEFLMPGSKERPLSNMLPGAKENKPFQCIKVLTLSGWNPPPGTRKMHGDLMYLYIITMEGVSHHITASTRGFYINQSTQESFIPKPADPNHLSHSLIELFNKLSPAFKKSFSTLLKKRSQKHPYERVPTPFQTYCWMAPQLEHTIDSIRAEEAYTARLGYEEHIPGQTRDWNEELQTTRELPRKNLPERLLRERAVFKVHSDFVAAATRGAMAVIDGNVMAINPGEDTKMQMFIWNNIFFSLGFDVRDHYKEFGGDSAAYVAPSNDLQGVKAYNTVDLEGLYTLGTVVVDYRGYRITAQSIIPGILEREQEESVIYGSIDFGKTVVNCDKYKELLSKTAQQLKILPHKVINHKGDEVEIFTSIECKGIKGNDGRNYVLDLLRTFPPDVNFLPIEGEEIDDDVKQFDFPRKHRHKLCCLRQELIESFAESRYMLFIRHAAYMLMQNQSTQQALDIQDLNKDKNNQKSQDATDSGDSNVKSESSERTKDVEIHSEEKSESQTMAERMEMINEQTEELKKILTGEEQRCPVLKKFSETNGKELTEGMDSVTEEAAKALITSPIKETFDSSHKEVIAKAAEAAGSLSRTDFDIRFNPDVYADGVTHAIHEEEYFKKQKKLIHEAARYVVTSQIPTFIRECLQHSIAPIDGRTLIEMLHQRGINVRYLGVIASIISTAPPLSYLHRLVISEMIIRSVKHLFKTYLQIVGMINLSAAISHFLNCFLGSHLSLSAPKNDEEFGYGHHGKKKKKSKKARFVSALGHDGTSWNSLTPSELWNNIKKEMKDYYHFDLKGDGVDSITEKLHLQKVTLLRELATSVGIQLLLREYDFNCKSKSTFLETDILNMFPKVKHINPVASDAYNFFQSGQTKIQQGAFQDGFELISEALNLFNNVYGPMHAEIAACLRMLARLHYLMQEHNEAIDMQQKAVMMSERCNGVDHPNTITEYMHLALYCFASGQAVNSLKLMYRARYLALIIYGEDHPEMAQFDSNIGLVLHGVGQFDLSLQFLEKALENNLKFHGPKSLKAALSYHLVARVQSCKGDFRAALLKEKDAFTIYREHFGETHDKTKESSECLNYLTQQAVTMQKTMNEIRKSGPRAAMRSIPITPPSPASVLETLNMINGIFVIPVSIRGQKAAAASDTIVIQPSIEDSTKVESPQTAEGTIEIDHSIPVEEGNR